MTSERPLDGHDEECLRRACGLTRSGEDGHVPPLPEPVVELFWRYKRRFDRMGGGTIPVPMYALIAELAESPVPKTSPNGTDWGGVEKGVAVKVDLGEQGFTGVFMGRGGGGRLKVQTEGGETKEYRRDCVTLAG